MKLNLCGFSINQRLALITAAGSLGLYGVIKGAQNVWNVRNVKRKIKTRRTKREEAIENLEAKLKTNKPPDDVCERILRLDTETLRDKIRSGELDMKHVLYAYQAKALAVHQRTNCLTDIIEEAEDYIDELLATGNKDGLLYGVPVSIKEHLSVKGYDVSCCCSNFINDPVSSDMDIIKLLKMEGAIPFVKTNIPQGLFGYETSNPIFGRTRNPMDPSRSVGGSSGGEGALVAGGGSLLGLCSDVGGSIRVPAHMNGVFGYMITPGRVNMTDLKRFPLGLNCVRMSTGPLGRDVSGIYLLVKSLCSEKARELDVTFPSIPLNDSVYRSHDKLKIGYLKSSAFCQAVPAVQRAVLEAKTRLQQLGHEVVEWTPPVSLEQTFEACIRATRPDGGVGYRNALKGDLLEDGSREIVEACQKPVWLRRLLAAVLQYINPSLSKQLLWSCGVGSMAEWNAVFDLVRRQREQTFSAWRAEGLDAVLLPTWPCPAPTFGSYVKGTWLGELWPLCGAYVRYINVLGCPAGVVPITSVTDNDVTEMADYPEDNWMHRKIKAGSEGTQGLSVSVQVATLPYEDEVCLRIMKELEEDILLQPNLQ